MVRPTKSKMKMMKTMNLIELRGSEVDLLIDLEHNTTYYTDFLSAKCQAERRGYYTSNIIII